MNLPFAKFYLAHPSEDFKYLIWLTNIFFLSNFRQDIELFYPNIYSLRLNNLIYGSNIIYQIKLYI